MTRDEFIAEARKFKETPFKHQGRSRKYGVDCVGILVVIGVENGYLKEKPEDRRYSRNPETFRIKERLDELLIPIDKEDMQAGDILLFKIPFHPQHVGIVTNYSEQSFGLIQAYQDIGKVKEHRLDQRWIDRIVQAYKVPGVD